MKQWLLTIIIIAFILLIGCESDEESLERRAKTLVHNSNYKITTLMYIYDPRVDICYAVYRLGDREGTITTVPYEKVKEYAHVIEYEDWERHHNTKKGVFK